MKLEHPPFGSSKNLLLQGSFIFNHIGLDADKKALLTQPSQNKSVSVIAKSFLYSSEYLETVVLNLAYDLLAGVTFTKKHAGRRGKRDMNCYQCYQTFFGNADSPEFQQNFQRL